MKMAILPAKYSGIFAGYELKIDDVEADYSD